MSKRDMWITLNVAFAGFMVSLDHYIVNICLPAIAKDLSVGINEVSLIVLAYFVVMASTLLIFGKLGDRIGFQSMFRLGYLSFGLGSLLCGISPSLNVLLFSRCVQGIGGAMLYSSCFAIIPRFLPSAVVGRAFGMLSTLATLGIIAGAPLGGFIAGFFHWQWVFLMNVPLVVVALLFGMRALPREEGKTSGAGGTFDVPGAVLVFLGLLSLIYGINSFHKFGWHSPTVLLSLAGSVLLFAAFVWRERHTTNPMVDLATFKNLDFSFTNLATLTAIMFMAGSNFLIPFYLVEAKELAVERAGVVFLVYSVTYMIVSPLAGRAADRVHPFYLRLTGVLLAAGAAVFFAEFNRSPGLWPVVLFLSWLGIAYGSFMSPNTKHTMSIVSPEQKGVVSGMFTTITMLGLVLGVSLFESVFSGAEPMALVRAGACAGQNCTSRDGLFSAFREAYWLGAFLCIASAGFITLARRKGTVPRS